MNEKCKKHWNIIILLQNRGVYMFRIDDNQVVDATMCGGPARYINHCCQPNCVAEVVPFEKDSKIIIIAKRKITRGEEVWSNVALVANIGTDRLLTLLWPSGPISIWRLSYQV